MNERLRRAQLYRRKADTARRAAEAAKQEDVQRAFRSAAQHYETLALLYERWNEAQWPGRLKKFP